MGRAFRLESRNHPCRSCGLHRLRHGTGVLEQVRAQGAVGPPGHPPGEQPPGDEEQEEANEGGARKAEWWRDHNQDGFNSESRFEK